MPFRILVLLSGAICGGIAAAAFPYFGLLELLFLVFGRPQDDRPNVAPLHIPLIIVIGITVGLLVRLSTSGDQILKGMRRLWIMLVLYVLMLCSAATAWTILSSARVDDFSTLVYFCVVTLAIVTTETRLKGYVLVLVFSGFYQMQAVLRHPSAMVEEIAGQTYERLALAKGTTVFGSANYLALFMVIMIFLCAGLLSYYKKYWQRVLLLSLIGGAAYVFFRANSRGASLGLAAGTFVMWLFSKNKTKSLVIIMVLGIAVLSLAPQSYWDRLSTIVHYQEDSSATSRLDYWGIALKLIPEHPIFGIGPDNFYLYAGNSPHDAYLQMAVEVGLPAMLMYFLWLSTALFLCWRTRQMVAPETGNNPYLFAVAQAVFCCLTALVVQGLTTGLAHREVVYVFGTLAIALQQIARSKPVTYPDTDSENRAVMEEFGKREQLRAPTI